MKTAVITGTSYGLGKAIAEMLLKNNFKVYGISRTKSESQNKNFVWIKADLLEEESLEMIKSSIAENKIDLLVNCAGVIFSKKSLDFIDNDFNKTFGLNFVAPIKLTSILKQKLNDGLVIYISSTSDRFAEENLALYCSSKAALGMYFDTIALENTNFKVLGILPVYADTNMLRKFVGSNDFDWKVAITPEKFAESFKVVLQKASDFKSGTRVIVGSNKNLEDTKDEEKLYYYNTDINEFKKLK